VKTLLNILWLGLKEIRSLMRDKVMVLFVVYAFTFTIYTQATVTSSEVNNASIAFADEDQSSLSNELINAFYPPQFKFPERISTTEVETAMDLGRYMFVVTIPPNFERDLSAGRNPEIQLSIDATAMQQAGIGAGYVKNIVSDRIASFMKRTDVNAPQPVNLVVRRLFNPNAISSWFKSVVAIINQLTLLTVVLTGAAVIREREHGTLEHLLVMPLTAFEIAMAKGIDLRESSDKDFRNLGTRLFAIDRESAQVVRLLGENRNRELNWAFDKLAQGRFILGSPQGCIEQLKEYERRLGVSYFLPRFDWTPGLPQEEILAAMKLFGTEVIQKL
jgi:hypothetical protein